MTINFASKFSLSSHPNTNTIALIPFLAIMFLVLSQVLSMVSVIKISYAEEHYYDSHINHSNFNVIYDNRSQIFGKLIQRLDSETVEVIIGFSETIGNYAIHHYL